MRGAPHIGDPILKFFLLHKSFFTILEPYGEKNEAY